MKEVERFRKRPAYIRIDQLEKENAELRERIDELTDWYGDCADECDKQ